MSAYGGSFKKREIVITISPRGEATVEAENFVGKGCTEATKPFLRVLGVPEEDTKKPEFWVENKGYGSQSVGGGW